MSTNKIIHYFEKSIVLILLALLGIIIAISTYELAVMIYLEIRNNSGTRNLIFLDINELFSIFSFILFIVIGLELFETIKIFLAKQIIPAEIILLVALTAIARKIIVLDYDKYDGLTYIGIACIVVGLSFGYYLIKKANPEKVKKNKNIE